MSVLKKLKKAGGQLAETVKNPQPAFSQALSGQPSTPAQIANPLQNITGGKVIGAIDFNPGSLFGGNKEKFGPFNPFGIFTNSPKNPFTNPEGAKKQLGEIWDEITGQAGKQREDILGGNPPISETGILPTTGTGITSATTYNPYEAQAKALAEAPTGPDFSEAMKTSALQAALAEKLSGAGGLYNQGAGAVTDLISNLQKQYSGDFGPGGSLAQAILQQGLSQNIAGVRSQLASQRGLSPALAARYAAQQTAQLGGQAAQQAGVLGLQQQLAAQQQLGQLGMGSAELGAGVGSQLLMKGRESDITEAIAKSDADLKKLNILASSDVGLKDIAAKTGLGEADIKFKIAAANQAAKMGDRQEMYKIIGGILGGLSQAGAAAAGKAYGGRIEGAALVDGDHPQNDTVPAMLSPGEIVIPRSAAQDKGKAKAFLDALDGWDEKASYSKVLKARRARA